MKKSDYKVALLGFGTVGSAVARILSDGSRKHLRITHVCNRNIEQKRVEWLSEGVTWTDDIEVVLESDVDIVIELIGGEEPATDWIRRSLREGKSVVTANKQVIARYGAELEFIAQEEKQWLRYEAAVAGGIPVIQGLRDGLSGDRLFRILGILNGTCNYILTRMESDQVSFEKALGEAQELGYAEADPTADIDGSDAQAKLAILTAAGLGESVLVDSIPLRTIRSIEAVDFVYAKRLGATIRQVSRAERNEDNQVVASVQPMLIPTSSTLAQVGGSRNMVVVEGESGGETAFAGLGAGGLPTAVAVVSDLESIARGTSEVSGILVKSAPREVVGEFVSPHYIRFVISDRPGIIAALAGVFSRHGVNVDSILQEPGWSKEELPFVMTLEACDTASVREGLKESELFDFHQRPPLWMPVLA